jgi:hypothetical protein
MLRTVVSNDLAKSGTNKFSFMGRPVLAPFNPL